MGESRPAMSGVPRAILAGVSAVLVSVALAACVPGSTLRPLPSTSASGQPSASATPVDDPELVPDGTADDNLPYFNLVNSQFLAADPTPGGRAIIDNLVAAGFDKAAMQVTPDSTSIGRDVDSVQFSVRFGDRCLVGQSSGAGYVGIVGPAVSDTLCLIGKTRAIDW